MMLWTFTSDTDSGLQVRILKTEADAYLAFIDFLFAGEAKLEHHQAALKLWNEAVSVDDFSVLDAYLDEHGISGTDDRYVIDDHDVAGIQEAAVA